MSGEVESTSDADARALFEVNFWGVVGVSRAAVKFFREVNPPGKGGVLLQNSTFLESLVLRFILWVDWVVSRRVSDDLYPQQAW